MDNVSFRQSYRTSYFRRVARISAPIQSRLERNQQTHCANEKQVQGRAVEAEFHAVVRLGFLVSVPSSRRYLLIAKLGPTHEIV